jgi:NAD-dependent deacetylase
MNVDALKEMIAASDNIVFFGGAGVSTESHIPDFRSAQGLYNEKTESRHSPEEILSHDFFMSHTLDFYQFYRSKMVYRDARPNKAHEALARLEHMGKLKAVITQNIDGLHQMAGSRKVLELHGSVHRNYCLHCGKFFDLDYVMEHMDIPRCDICQGIIKPDVVLYGENLNQEILSEAIDFIAKADVLIVGGTSLSVYPAAGLIHYYRGSKLVLINKTTTPYDGRANLVIYAKIGEVLGSIL